MKRNIITIDRETCNGCGQCIPNCPEGAIRMIDGKARLLGDLFCDGLGACLGECPVGAISIEEREAEPYDEAAVMENIITQGDNVIKAHLNHLQDHGETDLYDAALSVLRNHGLNAPGEEDSPADFRQAGCPGSRVMVMDRTRPAGHPHAAEPSHLTTWPVQLHLLPPRAPYFAGRHVLLAADCVAYAAGGFHGRFLKDKVLAIACPKLDDGQEIYLEKLKTIMAQGGILSLTVLTMEVPCCSGLARLVERALAQSPPRDLPVTWQVIGLQGEIKKETTLNVTGGNHG